MLLATSLFTNCTKKLQWQLSKENLNSFEPAIDFSSMLNVYSCFILGQKRSAWMKESCFAPIILSSSLPEKEIMMRALDVNNIKSAGKVINQMERNKLFPSPPLNVVCFTFCQYLLTFFVYNLWCILYCQFLICPYFQSYYHIFGKKIVQPLKSVMNMRREIIKFGMKGFTSTCISL